MISWSQDALEFFKEYHATHREFIDGFAPFPSNHLSLVRKDGALDLYHGVLRAVDAGGKRILDDVDYQEYDRHIAEGVENWTYMKFPYLRHLGREQGWYRVGPLARMNTIDFIPTPLAQQAFEDFRAYTAGKPNGMSMHMHWARLIEVLHCAEVMKELLLDKDLVHGERLTKGTKVHEGVGLIEAPRGTLFHHYRVGDDDLIEKCNLIVSTTNNNQPMNEAVHFTAEQYMNGRAVISEGMMNAVEVAIRAYDPCLSCATHALGKMPLELTVENAAGEVVDRRYSGD